MLTNEQIKEKAAHIRFFFSDVDGTLTDGCTYYSANGEELKKFSHIDGTGFLLLKKVGIVPGLITGEDTLIVKCRAEKLQLKHCLLGVKDKVEIIKRFAEENNCNLDEIAYMGDDLNDLGLISHAGLSFAVGNAHALVKKNAHICCKSKGGEGAFREAVEMLLTFRGLDLYTVFNQNIL